MVDFIDVETGSRVACGVAAANVAHAVLSRRDGLPVGAWRVNDSVIVRVRGDIGICVPDPRRGAVPTNGFTFETSALTWGAGLIVAIVATVLASAATVAAWLSLRPEQPMDAAT